MIKLLSIDDHKLFYQGLEAIFAPREDMLILQGYDQGVLWSQFSVHLPDVVLLDMYMPNLSGITVAKQIKKRFPYIKIIMLSLEVSALYLNELKALGIEGYLSKNIDTEELVDAVRAVYSGELVYHVQTVTPVKAIEVLRNDFGLTTRELEIYELVRQGRSSKEIAEELSRSILTVNTHRKNIRQKLKLNYKETDPIFSDLGIEAFFNEE